MYLRNLSRSTASATLFLLACSILLTAHRGRPVVLGDRMSGRAPDHLDEDGNFNISALLLRNNFYCLHSDHCERRRERRAYTCVADSLQGPREMHEIATLTPYSLWFYLQATRNQHFARESL